MSDNAQTPMAPVSWGEVIDKITILEIKAVHIRAEAALANVKHELALLSATATAVAANAEVVKLRADLKAVNEALWDVEDKLRDKERAKSFDAEFIELARAVYRTNDRRAALKKDINNALHSGIVEEKSYAAY
ncbi:MAG: DUF6165 family protein [Alphaproteobacteria bacterium]|nr:DUF6165 family protein [Alphaproteobacteria bacterium]